MAPRSRRKRASKKDKAVASSSTTPPMGQTPLPGETEAAPAQSSRLTYELHPLKNDVTLKAFFGVCSVAQLKTFRLVCKQWHELSLDSWRESAVLRVRDTGSFIEDYNQLKESLQLEQKPFSRLKVNLWDDYDLDPDDTFMTLFRNHPRLENVTHLELIGRMGPMQFHRMIFELMPNLVSLKLTKVDCDVEDEMEEYRASLQAEYEKQKEDGLHLTNYLLLQYPATHEFLRRLEFSSEVPDEDGYGVNNYAFLFWIMKRATQLNYVSIRMEEIADFREMQSGSVYEGPDEYPLVREFLKLLIRADVDRSKIKKLDIYNLYDSFKTVRDGNVRELLHQAELPLQELAIDLAGETTGKNITSVLQPYVGTLRKLRVHRDTRKVILPRTMAPSVDQPVMANLEQLDFGERLKDAFYFLSLFQTPKLKKLVLEEPSPKKALHYPQWDWIPTFTPTSDHVQPFWVQMASSSLETVEILDLKILQPMRVFTARDIEVLGEAMPGLRELSLPTGKPGFGAICKVWKKLRILKLYGGVQLHPDAQPVNDKAITGKGRGEKGRDKYGCIKDLTELTEFTLQHHGIGKKYVTDVAVFNGFLLVPNLKVLRIQMNFISAKGRESLKAKGVTLEEQTPIIRSCDFGDDEEGDFFDDDDDVLDRWDQDDYYLSDFDYSF